MGTENVPKWQHVIPMNDLIEHDTETKYCQCGPTVEWDKLVVIHKAIDGRDVFERQELVDGN